MHADQDDLVHVRFTGEMVDKLLKIDEEMYAPYVTWEGSQKVMYVELLKALYGTIKAAKLFWEKMTNHLVKDWGFTINPYDSCVANKVINGKQCTIVWHVDDLKISHVSEEVVDNVIDLMNHVFGEQTPMTVSSGTCHDYLGMTFDFTKPKKLQVHMKGYIDLILGGLPKTMDGVAITPATSNLFRTNNDGVPLSEEDKDFYHHVTMQLSYLAQWAQPDIRTAVSFLQTRVNKPDEDDFKKLARVVKYLRATRDMTLTLGLQNDGVMTWWVDASYAVHNDMKGHTGGTMSLGHGSIYSSSTKQKLVSRSSTEAELIGVYDIMPQLVWTGNFMRAQGMHIRKVVLMQDNTSTILLENNGHASSTK